MINFNKEEEVVVTIHRTDVNDYIQDFLECHDVLKITDKIAEDYIRYTIAFFTGGMSIYDNDEDFAKKLDDFISSNLKNDDRFEKDK